MIRWQPLAAMAATLLASMTCTVSASGAPRTAPTGDAFATAAKLHRGVNVLGYDPV